MPNPQDPQNKHRKPENPMFDLIPHRKGAQNYVPSFLTQYGPIREVRFQRKPDGTPDGGVHAIFTIAGRSDKPAGCSITQPNFSDAGNLSFRIPTPVFGAGLIEAITDTTVRLVKARSLGDAAGSNVIPALATNTSTPPNSLAASTSA